LPESLEAERPGCPWTSERKQDQSCPIQLPSINYENLPINNKSGLTPATHNFNEDKLMARWSHKHLAHLLNLGRFGVNHLLITPVGCTGRLGSFVSEVELGDHPLIETDEACLLKAGKECGKCTIACPVDALTKDDFDRRRCWDRLNETRRVLDYFSDLPESTDVCGKCSAIVPCSFKNPVAALKSGDSQ
jgi:epoxyqueuosine reductase QueG